MSQDPNRPLTSPEDTERAPEAARPAAGPPAAGDPSGMFPRDEALEGQETDRPPESRIASPAGGGAPQAVDPGLADQAPGGPAERPAWGQGADQGAGYSPRDDLQAGAGAAPPGMGTAGTETVPPADRGAMGQQPGGTVEEPPLTRFHERWPSVQGAFVDDPKAAVAEADRLVAEVIQEIEQRLTRRRQHMQGQWTGGESDTERLRQLIHGYRALFHRLLESEF